MVYTYWYIPISYLYYKLLNFENQLSKIDVYKKDNLLKIFYWKYTNNKYYYIRKEEKMKDSYWILSSKNNTYETLDKNEKQIA